MLDAAASKHRRKRREEDLKRLEALQSGDPARILEAAMKKDARPRTLRHMGESLSLGGEESVRRCLR